MCGWQVNLCDALVTHGPYLTSWEAKIKRSWRHVKSCQRQRNRFPSSNNW